MEGTRLLVHQVQHKTPEGQRKAYFQPAVL